MLRQQIFQLGDALVDPVAPFFLNQPVGQLVGLLQGSTALRSGDLGALLLFS